MEDGLRVRAGTLADYGKLAGFHYLANRPATATRVIVLEDPRPGVVGRFLGRRTEPRVAGVLVESLPALGCALRAEALGDRYTGWADRRAAARLLNDEVRCISRVVVHPQWRGLGLAVRLVREALTTATMRFTEALAAMGRVHPFFELAGMRAYRRWPLPRDQRLLDALRWAGLEPWELASTGRMLERLGDAGDPPGEEAGTRRAVLRRELRRWAGRGLSVEEQLALARRRLLCEPVYYLWGMAKV